MKYGSVKYGDINPKELTEMLIKEHPKLRIYGDVVEMALERFFQINANIIADPKTVLRVVNTAVEEEVESVLQQLVRDGEIGVIHKNGQDCFRGKNAGFVKK